MMTALNILSLSSLCLLAALSTSATSGERRAFVVGVDEYENFSSERQLDNAVSDAKAIAAALESVNFDEVTFEKNISRSLFNARWQDFLNTVEVGDTVVFYFSGHGVSIDRKNYLLPRSMPYIQYGRAEQIKSESLSLNNLLEDLKLREPAVTIMILDACRNDPLIPVEYQRNVIAEGGLASVSEPPEGTFIMYSAGAGKTALDNLPGDSSSHSVYTRNLLELIPQSGLDISTMARQLRSQVKQETSLVGGRYTQVPAHYDGLVGDFCFAKCEILEQPISVNEANAVVILPTDQRQPCVNCADSMTIVSWGGAYSNSQSKAYNEPYAAATGVKIEENDSASNAIAELRAMAKADEMAWDVVDVVASDAIRLCKEGLAIKIDVDEILAPAPDGTAASDDFGEFLISDCFIPQIVYSVAFGYRVDVASWRGREPTDICDVFDTTAFPGKRALEKRPINNLEWALLCDGVAAENIYDVLATDKGVERALAVLDSIKDDVIWWTAGAETTKLLADKTIVMGSTYNGRLFHAIEQQKLPVAMLWDAQVLDLDGWIIPNGLSEKRLNRAYHYVRYATSTKRLAEQAKYIAYSPARKSSAPFVGQHAELGVDMASHMPSDPKNLRNATLYNYEWWVINRDRLDKKFDSWL